MENAQILLEQILEAARAGEWSHLENLSARLPSEIPPCSESDLSGYLFHLRSAMIAARITRADLVKSLHRLSAASHFNQCG